MTLSKGQIQTVADTGDHVVIPADTRLQSTALSNGSPAAIAALMANAETALDELRNEFGRWLEQESARLGLLLQDYQGDSSKAQKDMLYRALHDMRGNAPAFGNPLAGKIADHLCKLIDEAGSVPNAIVEAHVLAIQAVIREKATTLDHPVGGVIIKELARASALVKGAASPS